MSEREKGMALEKVRVIYGALIAAAVYQVIDILRDTQECMIAADKIRGGY